MKIFLFVFYQINFFLIKHFFGPNKMKTKNFRGWAKSDKYSKNKINTVTFYFVQTYVVNK